MTLEDKERQLLYRCFSKIDGMIYCHTCLMTRGVRHQRLSGTVGPHHIIECRRVEPANLCFGQRNEVVLLVGVQQAQIDNVASGIKVSVGSVPVIQNMLNSDGSFYDRRNRPFF